MPKFIYKNGNIFDETAEAVVNPVNCVGIMGRGLALQFKNRYPKNFEFYKKWCKSKALRPGIVLWTRTQHGNFKYICNFPTKNHYKNPSKIEWIEYGLKDLKKQMIYLDVKSIAMPPIGCGLGGLEWKQVKPLIEKELSDLGEDVKVIIYEQNKDKTK